MLGRLVGGESGPDRGDLEENAARLAEIDGFKVEAVDHGRRPRAGVRNTILPGRVFVRKRGPGDVVHGAGAADARLLGRGVVAVPTFAPVAASLVEPRIELLELERVDKEAAAALRVGGVGAHAVEALERELGGDLRVPGHERLVVRLDG